MATYFRNAILSWMNQTGVWPSSLEPEDIANEEVLCQLLPPEDLVDADQRDSPRARRRKLLGFIERNYPDYKVSGFGTGEKLPALHAPSLLLHYYSLVDTDMEGRMKKAMCELDNSAQLRIKAFLEVLLRKKAVTRNTVEDAIIKSEESATQGSCPMEVFENSPKPKSSTPLKDFFESPVSRPPSSSRAEKVENRRLKVALAMERDRCAELEDLLEAAKRERKNGERKLNQEIQKLKQVLRETTEVVEDPYPDESIQSCPNCARVSAETRSKIMALREVVNCLEDKCSRLDAEKNALEEKVCSCEKQLSTAQEQEMQMQQQCRELLVALELRDGKLADLARQLKEVQLQVRDQEEFSEETRGSGDGDTESSIEWDYSDIPKTCDNLTSGFIEVQLQQAKSELEEKELLIRNKTAKLEMVQKTFQEFQRKTEEEIFKRDKDIDEKNSILAKLQDDVLKKMELIQDLQNDMIVLRETKASELTAASQKIHNLEGTILSYETKVIQLEEEISTKNMIISDLQTSYAQLEESKMMELAAASEKMHDLEKTISEKVIAIGLLEQEIIDKSLAIGNVEKLYASLEQSKIAELSAANKKINLLEATIFERETSIGHLEKENSEKIFFIQNLERSYAELDEKKNAELTSSSQKIHILEEKLSERQTAISYLEKQMEEKMSIIANLEKSYQELEETKKAELTAASDEISALQATIFERGTSIGLLETEIKEKISAIGNLEKLYQELEETKKAELSTASEEISALQATIFERESSISYLEKQMEEKMSIIANLEKLYQELEETKKAEFTAASEEISALQATIFERESSISYLEKQMEEKMSIIANLEKLYQELEETKKTELTAASEEISALQATIFERETSIGLLETEIKEKTSAIGNLEKLYQELEETKKAELTAASEEISALQATIFERESSISYLEKQMEEKMSIIANLEKLYQELEETKKTELTAASEEISALQATIFERETSIGLLETEIKEKTSAIGNLEKLYQELEETKKADLTAASKEISALQATVFERETSIGLLETEIKEKTSAIGNLEKLYQELEETKKADLTAASKEISALQATVFERETSIGLLETEIKEKTSAIGNLEKLYQELEETKKADLTAASKEISALQATVFERETSIGLLETEIKEKISAIGNLEKLYQELEETKKAELTAASEEISALQATIFERESSISHLEKEMEEKISAIGNLEKLYQELEEAKKAELTAASEEVSALQATIFERESSISYLEKQMEEKMSIIANLEKLYQELEETKKADLTAASKEISALQATIFERETSIGLLETEIKEKISAIGNLEKLYQELEETKKADLTAASKEISALQATIFERETSIGLLETEIKEKISAIGNLEKLYQELEETKKADLTAASKEISALQATIFERETSIGLLETEIKEKISAIGNLEKLYQELEETKKADLTAASKEISALQATIFERETSIGLLETEIKEKISAIGNLEKLYQELEETKKADLTAASKEISALQATIFERETSIGLLETEIKEKISAIGNLEKLYQELEETKKADLTAASKEISALQATIFERETSIGLLETEIKEKISAIGNLEKLYQELEETKKAELTAASEEISALQATIFERESSISYLEKQMEEKMSIIANLEKLYQELEETKKADLTAASKEISALQATIFERETSIGLLETEIKEKISAIGNLEKLYQELEETKKAELTAASEEVSALQATIFERESSISYLEKQMEEKMSIIGNLEKSFAEFQETKKAELTATGEEISALQATIFERETSIGLLETEIKEKISAIGNLEKLYQELEETKKAELSTASKEICVLQAIISERQTSISILEKEVEEKMKIIGNLEKSYQELEETNKAELTAASEDISVLQAKISERENSIGRLEKEMEEKMSIIGSLEKCFAEFQESKKAELTAASEKISSLQAMISERETSINCLEKEMEEKMSIIGNLEKSFAEFQDTKKAELTATGEEISVLRATIFERETSIGLLEGEMKEKISIIGNLEKLYQELEETKKAELSTACKEISVLQAIISERQTSISILEKEVEEKMKIIGNLEKSYQELEETKKAELTLASEKISSLQAMISERETSINCLEKEMEEKMSIIGNLEKSFAEFQETKKAELTATGEEISVLRATISERETSIGLLEGEMKEKISIIGNLEKSYQELEETKKAELTAGREEISALHATIFERETSISRLEKDMEEKISAIGNLEKLYQELDETKKTELTAAREEISALRATIFEGETSISRLEKEMEEKISAIGNLEKLYQELEETKKAELTAASKEISVLQATISERDASISRLEKEIEERISVIGNLEKLHQEMEETRKTELNAASEEISALRMTVSESKLALKVLEEDVSMKNNLIGDIQSSYVQLDESSKAELGAANLKIKELEIMQSEMQEIMNEQEKAMSFLKSELNKVLRSLEEVEKEKVLALSAATSELDTFRIKALNLETKLKDLNEEKSCLVSELDTLKQEFSLYRLRKEEETAAKENLCKELLSKVQTIVKLEQELQCLECKVQQQNTMISQLSGEAVWRQVECDRYTSEVALLKGELEESRKSVAEKDGMMIGLKESLAEKDSCINELREELIIKQRFLSERDILLQEAKAEIEELREREGTMRAEMKELQKRAEAVQVEREELLKQMKEAEVQAEEMKGKVEAAQAETEEMKKMVEAMQVEMEEAKKMVEVAEAEVEETNKKMVAAQSEMEEMKKRVGVAEVEMEEAKKRAEVAEAEVEETNNKIEAAQAEAEEMKRKAEAAQAETDELRKKVEADQAEGKELQRKVEELRHSKAIALQNLETELLERFTSEQDSLRKEVRQLREEHGQERAGWRVKLHTVHSKHQKELEELDATLKAAYEKKLEKLKEQMRTSFYSELDKKVQHHEKAIKELEAENKKLVERYCQAYHDSQGLRTQLWDLSEKFLKAKEEKHISDRRLTELHSQLERNPRRRELDRETLDPRILLRHPNITADVIDESVTVKYSRRRSLTKGLPPSFSQAFPPQDEEGEEFNSKYLADMKAGRCVPEEKKGRLTELQRRNSLYPAHLKSSYPAEFQFIEEPLTEEDVKFGGANDENFDTLSTNYLLPDKTKKKDRSQTSYKKPGPPTPGKNGGRLSLQGQEQGGTPHSVLREHNESAVSRKGLTPSRLKLLFGARSSRRDENSPATPSSRGLGLFRKSTKVKNHVL